MMQQARREGKGSANSHRIEKLKFLRKFSRKIWKVMQIHLNLLNFRTLHNRNSECKQSRNSRGNQSGSGYAQRLRSGRGSGGAAQQFRVRELLQSRIKRISGTIKKELAAAPDKVTLKQERTKRKTALKLEGSSRNYIIKAVMKRWESREKMQSWTPKELRKKRCIICRFCRWCIRQYLNTLNWFEGSSCTFSRLWEDPAKSNKLDVEIISRSQIRNNYKRVWEYPQNECLAIQTQCLLFSEPVRAAAAQRHSKSAFFALAVLRV